MAGRQLVDARLAGHRGKTRERKKNRLTGVVSAMTSEKPTILGVLARIYVDDIDAALPLYRELADGASPHRFAFRRLRLAKVGSFLLIEGADEEIRSHSATIAVRDVDAVARAIEEAGGELIEGPAPGPSGPRLIARHPDGSIIEYVQPA